MPRYALRAFSLTKACTTCTTTTRGGSAPEKTAEKDAQRDDRNCALARHILVLPIIPAKDRNSALSICVQGGTRSLDCGAAIASNTHCGLELAFCVPSQKMA